MLKAKVRADVLKELVDVLSTLVDEAKFNMSKDTVSCKAVDHAHVAMVDLTLAKKAFEQYKAKDSELGVDIDKLKEVLKLAGAGDTLTIDHDEDKNKLVFNVGNITRRMALVDTAGISDPKVPNLNLPVKVSLNSNELRQGIKAAEAVSDHVTLIASPDSFEMASEGDTDSVDLKLPKDFLEELDCKESTKSMFALEYFSNMVKSIGNASIVTLHLGSNYPIKMEFDIADGQGHVTYLLAPRVESE